MRWLRRLRRGWSSQQGVADAMEHEMRQHIDFETESRVRAGMAPDEARRTAFAQFGGYETFKEEARSARPRRMFDDIARDLRLAVRQLARRRVFSLAIIVTVALGLSAATTIYSLTHAVLIRPLAYPEPDRIALLWPQRIAPGSRPNVTSVEMFETWRDNVKSVESMALMIPFRGSLATDEGAVRLVGVQASAAFFDVLGVRPVVGRAFTPAESKAIVLSDHFWRARLGARPDAVGSQLRLDEGTFEVVGIMPPSFESPKFGWFSDTPDFWVSFLPDEQSRSWGRAFNVIGRLTPTGTVEQLDAELKALAIQLATLDTNKGWTAVATSLDEVIRGPYRTSLNLLLAGVAVLLLMAMLSLAHLASAEMGHFDHELSVRTALGATRQRLGRQLVVLLGVLLVVGVAAAAVLIPPEVAALRGLLPEEVAQATIPVRWELVIGSLVVMFALLAIVAVVPALRRLAHSSGSLITLRSGAREARGLRGGGFIVAHVACALVIVVAAGLMLRTLQRLEQVKLGFDDEGMLTASVTLSSSRASSLAASAGITREVQRRIAALPGVHGVGAIDVRPLAGGGQATSADRSDNPPSDPEAPGTSIDVRQATGSYFATADIPLLEGSLDAFEQVNATGMRHGAISQSLAKELWPGESPIGRILVLHRDRSDSILVDAVVGDVHLRGARTPARGTAYASIYHDRSADGQRNFWLLIRADGAEGTLIPAIRKIVTEVDPGAPLYAPRAMEDIVRESEARERFTAALLSLFALAALALASAGVFGVLMRDVVARERELAVRLALGASPQGILRQVLWRGLSRTLIGLALGAGGAWALARTMRALLFGVSELDVFTFAATAGVLLSVTLGAVLIPGARAARTEPQGAMRGT